MRPLLADRNGSPGQQRFIRLHVDGFNQQGVGGHATAFGKHNEIILDQVACQYPLAAPVADHDGLRTGEVSECRKGSLGPALLHDNEPYVD